MSFLNLKTQKRFVATNFTFTSASYIDWKDAPAGNTCAVTVTKVYANSDIIIKARVSGRGAGANDTFTVGVNDGATDYFVGSFRAFSAAAANIGAANGRIKISGLAAGTYTFTLRVKTAGGNTQTCATTESAFLTAYEANGSTGIVADATSVVPGSTVTLSSTTYADLTDGTNPITLTVTKASASSLLVVEQSLAWTGATVTVATIDIAVAVGGVDTKTGLGIGNSTSVYLINGKTTLSGLAAGSTTLTFRYKRTTANGSFLSSGNASMSVIELEPT